MSNVNIIFLSKILFAFLFVVFSLTNIVVASGKSYDLPINFNKRYVNPEEVVTKALLSRDWQVKEKQPGKIIGWLNNFKDHEILLEITYDDSQIRFKHISSRKLNCNRSCKFKAKHYDKWRLYLRKSIALNIHTLAIDELLKTPDIKGQWLSVLKEGTVEEKTKLARNIIDIELFNKDALKAIEEDITNNYNSKMSRDEVQQYAFYCKVLARTKDAQYLPLLIKVREKAAKRALRKYVKGYINTNFPANNS